MHRLLPQPWTVLSCTLPLFAACGNEGRPEQPPPGSALLQDAARAAEVTPIHLLFEKEKAQAQQSELPAQF